jgi:hypothetical protein
VVTVWAQFEITYQNQQINQHAQELQQLKDTEANLLKKVSEIITTGGQ